MTDRGAALTLAVLGLAVIAVGVVGVALEWDLGGAGWFLLAGCGLVALGVLHTRLSSLDVQVAGAKFGALFTAFTTESGTVAAVEIKRLGMTDLAIAYQLIHDELREAADVETRIRLQDALVDSARRRSAGEAPKKRALTAAMHSQSAAARAIALGVAQAHPGVVSLKAITRNITTSQTGNEQFQAMRVAALMVPTLGDRDLRKLRQVLVASPYIADDLDRRLLRDQMLAAIDAALA